jgi:hypothetical protein
MAGNATFGRAGVPSATLTATEAPGATGATAGEYVPAADAVRTGDAARSAGAQAVCWTARAARNWRSKAVGGESRFGAPKWNPWA